MSEEELDYTVVAEMSDEEIDEYVLFAMGNTTGFSKGTANVSARDLKKLRPLIKFYAKKPHPFTACVNDNRKRFGPLTNKYCAIIKDLIVGNTKWRNQNKKKHLSDQTLRELFELDVPDHFFAFLTELEDEDIQEMIEDDIKRESAEFAQGEVAWDSTNSYNSIRSSLEKHLNGIEDGSPEVYDGGMKFWVNDISSDSKALVCEGGSDYYVVPFNVSKKGDLTVGEETDWKAVTQAWVEEKVGLSDEGVLAEMFFAVGSTATLDEEGLLWKPVMREGTWAYSPSAKGAVAKPIKVVKDGASSKSNLTISLTELKNNFDAGAIEHVTIPTSHQNKVHENTGFVKKLRINEDDEGRAVLEAGHLFTDKEIERKALDGSIANTSAGVLFDFIEKEKGRKFGAVVEHIALTNRPWLTGMKPFGVNASENREVIGFSEGPIDPAETGGGEGMTDEAFDIKELGFSDPAELKAALAAGKKAQAEARERDIADTCKAWQTDGKTPALVAEAQTIMMADEGTTVLNLSEDKDGALTATDIVKRLVEASASVKLDQDPITEEENSGDKPKDKESDTELSQEVKTLASHIYLSEDVTEEQAVAKAKEQLAAKSSVTT